MSKTSLQYQLDKPGGAFSLVPVEFPVPRPTEISIRTKAIALNPLDWKSQLFGVLVGSWPAVIGIDSAGVVEAVGISVKEFVPGDEVLTICGFDGMGNRAGAFQEVVTVPAHFAAKKPKSLSFPDAASLP